MLLKILAWLFTPPKRRGRNPEGEAQFLVWFVLLIFASLT